MNLHSFYSIRGKIILLVVLGIAGVITIAAANKYIDMDKGRDIKIGRNSQMIVRNALEGLMIEEQFLNTRDGSLLPELGKLNKEMQDLTSHILSLSNDAEINTIVKKLLRSQKATPCHSRQRSRTFW